MLTCTYSRITLLIEQEKARRKLTKIRDYFHECAASETIAGSSYINTIEGALSQLIKFDSSRHRRYIELYVIPAIKNVTQEGDRLLSRLDFLSSTGAQILDYAIKQLQASDGSRELPIKKLSNAMERYCDTVLHRLDLEEKELFPLAWRSITHEGWFQIASQFISHQEHLQQARTRPMEYQNDPPPFASIRAQSL